MVPGLCWITNEWVRETNKTKKDDAEDDPVDVGDSGGVGGLLDGVEDD